MAFFSTKDLFRIKSVDQIIADVGHQEVLGLTSGSQGSGHPPRHQLRHQLRRSLGVWDLTLLGIAAIVGAGIFSTVGNAAASGGPAVVFLFVLTAVACAFSALCYAEFASAIPIAGSAYTYAYASFGELFAWIIGWDLVCEYAIGNIAVAISWSEYFAALLAHLGIQLPIFLSTDTVSASRAFTEVSGLLARGQTLQGLAAGGMAPAVLKGYEAWLQAPRFMGLPVVCNLPALFIVTIITAIVFVGIQESKILNNILVAIKLAVVLLVIVLGACYIHPGNWVPFAPHGVSGVMKGVSAVFFAYIGFDAISTTAEECKDPQRDLPRGMLYSLVICTVLYIAVSLVLTGMVSSTKLAVGDPLAFVFGPSGANIPWVSALISVSAVVALSTVLLVFQIGQPRIWMAMSRDGLLPRIFSSIHPRYKTPWFSTLLTGVVVAIPSLFMNLTEMTDLTSIGTLFAFVLVCGGVLRLDQGGSGSSQARFKVPYVNAKYLFPALLAVGCLAAWTFNREGVLELFGMTPVASADFGARIPLMVYLVGMSFLGVLSFLKDLSLIPVLGLATCGYLMTELGVVNWIRFGSWLIVGLVVYFLYGARHSRLGQKSAAAAAEAAALRSI